MGKYYVDEIPSWMVETPVEEDDEDFAKIIDFFQFHAPVTGQSARCKTLQEYGWDSPWKKPYWLNKQLKRVASNHDLLFTAESQGRMDANLEKANLSESFPSDMLRERICVANNKKNQFMSVFYHIRDSFAHGRFFITEVEKQKIIVMEDVAPRGSPLIVTGRMIIKKQTLLKWIEIINGGEKEYSKHYVRDGDL